MNVPCEKIKELLDPFLDNDLSRREKVMVKKHLKGCPSCRTALEKERETEEMLAALPRLRCPDKVVRKIEALTIGHHKSESIFDKLFHIHLELNWRILSLGVAATAVILLFVLHPWGDEPDSVSMPYTQDEVQKAKDQAKWSLAYIAKTVNQTEIEVLEDVILKDLPRTVRKSLREAVPIFQGGQ